MDCSWATFLTVKQHQGGRQMMSSIARSLEITVHSSCWENYAYEILAPLADGFLDLKRMLLAKKNPFQQI